MRTRFARPALAAALFAAALFFYPGCGPAKLQLGLDENVQRVARVAAFSGSAETAALAPLAVNDTRIVHARALNAYGDPVRNEAVGFSSDDAETVKVLSVWGTWPDFYASVRGLKAGTAEVVCTASSGAAAASVTVPVSDTAASTSRDYIRFVSPDTSPLPVGRSRVYAVQYVLASGAVKDASLVFELPKNTTVAKIASSDTGSVTLTGSPATGEIQLFVRDAANVASAAITVTVGERPVPYIRFVNPDWSPLDVDASRTFTLEYVANADTGLVTASAFTAALSDAAVATSSVNLQTVRVTGLKAGAAQLVVRDAAGTAAASAAITVRPCLKFITPDQTPIAVGNSRVFTVNYVTVSGGIAVTPCTFTVSSPAVLTISLVNDNQVTLTGAGAGNATLTAVDAAGTAAAISLPLTVQ